MNESKLKSSVMFRMFVTAMVVIFLLILASIVGSLISERERRRNEAIQEVSQKWGSAQTITGPILTIPFKRFTRNEKGKITSYTDNLHIMPETLYAEVDLNPEIRYRGIYEVILYQALIKISGAFVLPKFEAYDISPENLILRDAFITVGITDLRGIKNTIILNWDSVRLPASPGVKSSEAGQAGFTVFPGVSVSKKEYVFSVDLRLNGSGEFNMTPVGKEIFVSMSSKWDCPSFIGNFLPEKREITPHGFKAGWKVQYLNRNFPQTWTGCNYKLDDSQFGVRLHLPVDQYQKVTRAVKYAIMFIVLTFMAFFLTEIFSRAVIHPVQYTLIGLAIILFYAILLSLSEHIPFNISYAIASMGVICLISAYAKSVLKSRTVMMMIAGILAVLYLFLFVTLQLEDYALLLGSIGLFVILAAVMYVTRRIDWFDIGRTDGAKKAPDPGKEGDFLETER
ncbi:MAG: cell envelope integrity protein CreD [Thermodesulfobacteriota bacterium]